MSPLHKFKIHVPFNTQDAFIEIDGKRLEGVTRIEFVCAPDGKLMDLKLTVHGYVDVTGPFNETELLLIDRKATP